MNVPANITYTGTNYEAVRVTYYRASVTASTPTETGVGEYQMSYRCTHRHTKLPATDACADRLARALKAGRLPKWAERI